MFFNWSLALALIVVLGVGAIVQRALAQFKTNRALAVVLLLVATLLTVATIGLIQNQGGWYRSGTAAAQAKAGPAPVNPTPFLPLPRATAASPTLAGPTIESSTMTPSPVQVEPELPINICGSYLIKPQYHDHYRACLTGVLLTRGNYPIFVTQSVAIDKFLAEHPELTGLQPELCLSRHARDGQAGGDIPLGPNEQLLPADTIYICLPADS